MLRDFLHFNRQCPSCGEPLGLYMQWLGSLLFRAQETEPHVYDFRVLPNIGSEPTLFSEENMLLGDRESYLETAFSSNALENEAKRFQIYFYFLCNPAGLKQRTGFKREINLYKGCYYRSSPAYEFKKNEETGVWSLELTHKETSNLVNKTERFSLKKHKNGVEKVYLLSLNYLSSQTEFWHYAVSDAEKKQTFFKPNMFEKKMPILKNRPNLEDKDRLIERFDSWIIMS